MKLTKILKQLIEQQIKLQEMFKSEKLRKLNSYLPKGKTLRALSSSFGIALDQVTDDQVSIVRGSVAKKLMSKNPNLIGFFIWDGADSYNTPRGLMGVRMGGKFVSLHQYTGSPYTTRKDPSYVRGYNPKRSGIDQDSGIRNTTGSSNSTYYVKKRYGTKIKGGGYFTASDYWLEDVIVYLIDTAEVGGTVTDLQKQRQDNQSAFRSLEQLKSINLNRYREAIKQMRTNADPEFSAEYKAKLDSINVKVNAAVQRILSNPAKFKYASIDHSVTYGSGRTQSTYTTSLLKLVTELYDRFDDMINSYKNPTGRYMDQKYYKRQFDYTYNKIIKVITNINAVKLD